jgi:hypothetical protein
MQFSGIVTGTTMLTEFSAVFAFSPVVLVFFFVRIVVVSTGVLVAATVLVEWCVSRW